MLWKWKHTTRCSVICRHGVIVMVKGKTLFSVIVIDEIFFKVIVIDPKIIDNSLFYYISCCKPTKFHVCLHVVQLLVFVNNA